MKRRALIIGNSKYEDPAFAELVTPGKDAKKFAEILRAPDIGNFDTVITLFDETEGHCRREISRFLKQRSVDDLSLLYFSGHGVLDDQGQLFFAVRDSELEILRATAISANLVRQEMDSSYSRQQLLILDCCYSGAYSHGAKGVNQTSISALTTFSGTGLGRIILTATDATQYAWEGSQLIGNAENSVFTHFLIEGLETGLADRDKDGEISIDELYDYVYENIVTHTPNQTPRKFADGQQGQIVIAKNRFFKPTFSLSIPYNLEYTYDGINEAEVYEIQKFVDTTASMAGFLQPLNATIGETKNGFQTWLMNEEGNSSDVVIKINCTRLTDNNVTIKMQRFLDYTPGNKFMLAMQQFFPEAITRIKTNSWPKRSIKRSINNG
jgi:hypothetical protein